MKPSLDVNKLSFSQFKWLIYPLLVIIFIFLSQNWLWNGPTSVWNRITLARIEVGDNVKLASALATKLAALQKIDVVADTVILQSLNQAVPPVKDLTTLVAEMQSISFLTQIPLLGYKSTAESRFSVTFGALDFSEANKVIIAMYQSVPLVSIQSIAYSPERLTIELIGAMRPFENINPDPNKPLPDYQQAARETAESIKDFQTTSIIAQEFTPSLPLTSKPF